MHGAAWLAGGLLWLLPMVAAAEDWRLLDGAETRAALTARTLRYDSGAQQDFLADGRTLYESDGAPSWGQWRIEGARYCSVWPPSDRWDCYDVDIRGLDIRFRDGLSVTVGRYVDLG